MRSTTRVPGDIPLMVAGYKYNYQMVLGFIANKGAGSTGSGDPYLSHYLIIITMILFALLFVLACFIYISMSEIK